MSATTTKTHKDNLAYLKETGCIPKDSTFVGGENIPISTKNFSNMPNRQILFFVGEAEACTNIVGRVQSINFPRGFIVPDQVGKIKFTKKKEFDTFDATNSNEAIDYVVGSKSTMEWEAAFMNSGAWKDFVKKYVLEDRTGLKANVVTLMLYGVTNPVIDKDSNITGDGIEGILKFGPLEAGEIIATGDAKKMSMTKFTQHTAADSQNIVIPNKNGEFNELIHYMFGLKDIQSDLWDNENPNRLLR